MQPPINIQTKKGMDFYRSFLTQFEWCKYWNLTDWFKQYIIIENANKSRRLIELADNGDFDNQNVFNQWKEDSDCVAVLSYFSKRI